MATQMLAAGVPIATVSQRLSHARASTTLNVYAHSVPGGDRKAAEILASILANDSGDGVDHLLAENRSDPRTKWSSEEKSCPRSHAANS